MDYPMMFYRARVCKQWWVFAHRGPRLMTCITYEQTKDSLVAHSKWKSVFHRNVGKWINTNYLHAKLHILKLKHMDLYHANLCFLTSWINLSMLLKLVMPQFCHLYNENNSQKRVFSAKRKLSLVKVLSNIFVMSKKDKIARKECWSKNPNWI